MDENNALAAFQGKEIRKIWHKDEWWFSVVDIVAVLTEQEDFQKTRKYWNKLSQRLREEGSEVVTNCHQLKLQAPDGKMRLTDCINTEGAFRIVQSIPSKKAEPFKLWLAKVGYERVQEIENPELAQDRAKTYYELKGYPASWIEKRLRGIAIRQDLTDEWKAREVKTEQEFAILTNEISKATFGKTVGEYKDFKGLQKKNENLRDHMTDMELIFTMLGEASTTELTKKEDAHGMDECKDAAQQGGAIAGRARKDLEKKLQRSIVSKKGVLEKKHIQ
ncbi:MAG: Bro-N domain-containing protein [Candidatus Woesearchaeota archaeon]|nr:Bro-N domain-containing protein [Candidatus Woesearchaeota archaeon]